MNINAQMFYTALLGLRGHIGVVNDAAEFYYKQSRHFIIFCLREVNQLPIEADSWSQDQAQEKLTETTNIAAKMIQEEGEQLYVLMETQINGRLMTCRDELNSIADGQSLSRQEMLDIERAGQEVTTHATGVIRGLPQPTQGVDLGPL